MTPIAESLTARIAELDREARDARAFVELYLPYVLAAAYGELPAHRVRFLLTEAIATPPMPCWRCGEPAACETWDPREREHRPVCPRHAKGATPLETRALR